MDPQPLGAHLAEYTRLGLSTIVGVDYTEPRIRYDLAHGTGADPYAGLDRFGRVVDLLWRNYGTGEDVVRIKHGYDRAGNRLYREDPVAAAHGADLDEAYTYDGLYQLKTFIRGALNAQKTAIAAPTFRQAWDFDTTGNWARFREDRDGDGKWDLDQTREHNKANEITAFESTIGDLWISPQHDRNGNMIRIPQPKDPTKQFTLKYDAWNRLVKVSDPAGPVADYHYDGRNFRVVKEVHRDPNNPIPGEESAASYPETRHFYYNAEWQCLEERLETAPSVPAYTADRQFIWGLRYIDDLLLRDRATQPGGDLGRLGSALDERLYAIQDANWNVLGVVGTDGTAEERYSYRAYGDCTVLSGTFTSRSISGLQWLHLKAGCALDQELRVYYSRARSYYARLARFTSRDPIGYARREPNLYRYVRGNPLLVLDPHGLDWLDDAPASTFLLPSVERLLAVPKTDGPLSQAPAWDGLLLDVVSGVEPGWDFWDIPAATSCNLLQLRRDADDYWETHELDGFGVPIRKRPPTRDEVAVIALCKGDRDCELRLAQLMRRIRFVPRQFGNDKCFKWIDALFAMCPDYTYVNGKIVLGGNAGMVLQPFEMPTKGGKPVVTYYSLLGLPVKQYTAHGLVKVTFKAGGTAYFDIGSSSNLGQFGGDDHWWIFNADVDVFLDPRLAVPYVPECYGKK